MRSKMMMITGVALMLNLCSNTSKAQTETTSTKSTTTETPNTDATAMVKTSHPMAVSALLGTAGVGLEVKREMAENLTLRLGMSALPFSFTRIEEVGNVTVNGFYKVKFTNIHLLADYDVKVTKNFSFRGTAGLGYFTKAKVDVNLKPVGNYYYGDIQLNDGTMGEANLTADWKGLAPFVGIGFGKAIPKHKINLSFDLGTYYFINSPKVEMVTSGYLQGNERERKQIQENLKSYSWLPTLQFSLNYKL